MQKNKDINNERKTWTCEYCNTVNRKEAAYCAECGAAKPEDASKPVQKRKSAIRYIASIFTLVIVAGIFLLWKNGYIDIDEWKTNIEFEKVYDSGVDYLKENRYEEAVSEFEKIDKSWRKYEKVEEKISEAKGYIAFEQLKELMEKKDYDAAIQIYKDNKEHLQNVSEAADLYQKCIHSSIMKKVEESSKNKDYEAVINIINDYYDTVKDDEAIMRELKKAQQNYRESVIVLAKEAYQESGTTEAIMIINESLNVLENDEDLLKEKEKYQDAAPIELASLEPFTYGRRNPEDLKNIYDIQGNMYDYALQGQGKQNKLEESEYSCTYDIGKEYDILTGIIAVNESSKGKSGEGTIKIFGDNMLLGEYNNITSDTKAFQIEVSVTGITDLKIVMFHNGSWSDYVDVMLCDAKLQKDIS